MRRQFSRRGKYGAKPTWVRFPDLNIVVEPEFQAYRGQEKVTSDYIKEFRSGLIEKGYKRFASKAEARWAVHLYYGQSLGQISELEFQVKLPLIVSGKEITPRGLCIDFKYIKDGLICFDDVKGAVTREFKVKWQLAKTLYPDYSFRLVYKGAPIDDES